MTTEQVEQTQLRPFHETIVEAIDRCRPLRFSSEILLFLRFLKKTEIPKGHDEIIAAIEKYFVSLDLPCDVGWTRYIREMRKSLLAQKQAAETKVSSEKKSVNLDELKQEIEKLRLLVKSYKLGSGAAYSELQNGLDNLNRKLVKQVLSE